MKCNMINISTWVGISPLSLERVLFASVIWSVGCEVRHHSKLHSGIVHVSRIKGWRILDVNGKTLHEIGTLFTNGLVGDPVLPRHVQRSRQSYQWIASQTPSEAHYYGHALDGGSPFFNRASVRVASAPTKFRRTLSTTWAALKKQ